MKKYLPLVLLFSASFCTNAQGLLSNFAKDKTAFSNFKRLSDQQLLDTADYYIDKNQPDTALACYSLVINAPSKSADSEHQKRIAEALNRSAVLYYNMYDYREAYKLLIDALLMCEKSGYATYESKVYNNIGNIYYRFNKYDIAKTYFSKALHLPIDTVSTIVLLNNLGAVELESGNLDSAFYLFCNSMEINRKHKCGYQCNVLNNLARLYIKKQLYDSADYYCRLSLKEAKSSNNMEIYACNLSDLGQLFLELDKPDSALLYIDSANNIAEENKFLGILSQNYFILSQMEERKGHSNKALEYFKRHASLRDSAYNVDRFSEINQLQRLYEVSKTNEQIQQLTIEQQIKERTIYYQKIVLAILLLICAILLFTFFQKRQLDTAYKTLFEKNIEIIDFQKKIPEKDSEKYKKSALTDNMQGELLDKILIIMDDTSIICDTKFTIGKLAELVQSNHLYVSQAINQLLKKNFRSFLNGYRIREAQRLLSEPDADRYTIESIAFKVGFKSRNAFSDSFKEITGVSPNFYFKSIQKQQNS